MIRRRFSNRESGRNKGLTKPGGARGRRGAGMSRPARPSSQRQPRPQRGRTGRSKVRRRKVRCQGSIKLSQKTLEKFNQF